MTNVKFVIHQKGHQQRFLFALAKKKKILLGKDCISKSVGRDIYAFLIT